MSKEKQIDIITDLLIDFDEMGFAPTTLVPNPEAYAIEWKKKLTDAWQGYLKQSENVIELPCKVGDKVYFNYVELNEICPATVIGIYINYYTPSIPCWVTIEYESQLIGRHEVKIAVDVFNLVCHKTKEEAEAKMKGGEE